jgi:bifunctional DNA-binding transcriptional regulator/antitoxin component of YhaV-PrlF toxin-antitoxin module
MTITVKSEKELVVPASVQRQAGIKNGDRLKFDVSAGMVIITPVSRPTYRPTKAELSAIRKGEAAMARGEYVSLPDFLHGLDRPRRKAGAKTARKVSR